MYVSSKVVAQNTEELIAKIFPDSAIDPNTNASHFTLAAVATNSAMENYQTFGANLLSGKECPPEVDCPPWHTAPEVQ